MSVSVNRVSSLASWARTVSVKREFVVSAINCWVVALAPISSSPLVITKGCAATAVEPSWPLTACSDNTGAASPASGSVADSMPISVPAVAARATVPRPDKETAPGASSTLVTMIRKSCDGPEAPTRTVT
ncbi:MAG: hypothetical protein OXU61_12440, partial [Gammaproteobacteria bacterium]|nr:hypothetical protein [Gammaproteobacteria bacterium]